MRSAKLPYGVVTLATDHNPVLTILPSDTDRLPFIHRYEWWQKDLAERDYDTIVSAAHINRKQHVSAYKKTRKVVK